MRKITGIFTIAIPNLHATFLKHPNESIVSQKALQIWETRWTDTAMMLSKYLDNTKSLSKC